MKPVTIEIKKNVKNKFLSNPGYVQAKLNEMLPGNLGFSENPEKIMIFLPEGSKLSSEEEQRLREFILSDPQPKAMYRIEEVPIEELLPERIKSKLVNQRVAVRREEGVPLNVVLMCDEELSEDELKELEKIDWRSTSRRYRIVREK